MGLSRIVMRLVAAGAMALGWIGQTASADQSISRGDYTIHYSAFTTDILSPHVAKTYGILRSRTRGMVNVAVLKSNGVRHSVEAQLSGTATNLNGQLKVLDIRKVKDGDAIYYVSELPVHNEEVLDFILEVTPAGSREMVPVKFRQQFFTE